MNTEQLKQAALAATPDAVMAANPATILALLECVDALRLQQKWSQAERDNDGSTWMERVQMCSEAESATRAALQKLEAL